jgi:hypothetical protein
VNRRDFLLLKVRPGTRVLVLSCEEMYMRFLDSQIDETTPDLFERLRAELWRTERVELAGEMWLTDEAFRAAMSPLLDAFRARGGRIIRTEGPEAAQAAGRSARL